MTAEQPDEHDPQATVWRAITSLERKAYTRKEIHDTLRRAAESLRPEGGFNS
jgi:hypothetical protein